MAAVDSPHVRRLSAEEIIAAVRGRGRELGAALTAWPAQPTALWIRRRMRASSYPGPPLKSEKSGLARFPPPLPLWRPRSWRCRTRP